MLTKMFSGLGKHKKIKVRLITDESVIHVTPKQWKISFNLNEKAKREDDQPTAWCTNPVIEPKPHNPEAI